MAARFAVSWLGVLVAVAACSSTARPSARPETSLAGYPYLTFVTGGADPGAELPMIIGLHYSGARPEAIVADFDAIEVPVRIVLPQGRYPRRQGYSWFPASYRELDAAAQQAVTFEVKDELVAFVDAVTARFPTSGKPILEGISYGGDLSYLIAIHHPDRIAAAFPVGARFPAEWMPATNTCATACAPVFAMHGAQDTTVPFETSRLAAARLADAGYRVEFHAYPDVAHDFSAQMKADFTREVRHALGSDSSTRVRAISGTLAALEP